MSQAMPSKRGTVHFPKATGWQELAGSVMASSGPKVSHTLGSTLLKAPLDSLPTCGQGRCCARIGAARNAIHSSALDGVKVAHSSLPCGTFHERLTPKTDAVETSSQR